eukprot:m.77596 g.77596  ORF g.77596 m.77596 type:complete len:214 (-) comp14709_c0_seq1:648-1289(-)
MWSHLLQIVSMVLGSLYPGYASFKAIKNKDMKEYMRWMHYWTVYAFFSALEMLMDLFVYWLPLYYEGKLLFIILMLLPQTQFAEYIFHAFLHPTLLQHEDTIDATMAKAVDAARGHTRELSISMLMRVKSQAMGIIMQMLQAVQRVEQQATGSVVTTDVRTSDRLLRSDGAVIEETTTTVHRTEEGPPDSPRVLRSRTSTGTPGSQRKTYTGK